MSPRKIRVTPSSGNVFADLGLPDAEKRMHEALAASYRGTNIRKLQRRAFRDTEYRVELMREASAAFTRGDPHTLEILCKVARWKPWWKKVSEWWDEQRYRLPSGRIFWHRGVPGPWVHVSRDYGLSGNSAWNCYASVGRLCAWVKLPMSQERYKRIIPKGYEDRPPSLGAQRLAYDAMRRLRSAVKGRMNRKEFDAFMKECKRERDERPLRWMKQSKPVKNKETATHKR